MAQLFLAISLRRVEANQTFLHMAATLFAASSTGVIIKLSYSSLKDIFIESSFRDL